MVLTAAFDGVVHYITGQKPFITEQVVVHWRVKKELTHICYFQPRISRDLQPPCLCLALERTADILLRVLQRPHQLRQMAIIMSMLITLGDNGAPIIRDGVSGDLVRVELRSPAGDV